MNREEFFSRVRSAAAAGRAHQVHIRDDLPADVGYAGAGDDLPARLAAEIVAVGGTAVVVESIDAAREALRNLLVQLKPQAALSWQHPLLERLKLNELLADLGMAVHNHASLTALAGDAQRAQELAADVGISSVSYAVAETGTLALGSRPGQERIVSLLPPVHVAIVEEAQIVADLFDLFAALDRAGSDALPTNLALVTGPSKTGDIELTLTTGVHGPGTWHAIVIRAAN
ncbi:MAG: LUD domain-containing protein [Planctomycetia bacterium]|nr:LUD domain-containing protein [Planctomycetia bacterium]